MSDGHTEVQEQIEEANMRAYREGRSQPLQRRMDELAALAAKHGAEKGVDDFLAKYDENALDLAENQNRPADPTKGRVEINDRTGDNHGNLQ